MQKLKRIQSIFGLRARQGDELAETAKMAKLLHL